MYYNVLTIIVKYAKECTQTKAVYIQTSEACTQIPAAYTQTPGAYNQTFLAYLTKLML